MFNLFYDINWHSICHASQWKHCFTACNNAVSILVYGRKRDALWPYRGLLYVLFLLCSYVVMFIALLNLNILCSPSNLLPSFIGKICQRFVWLGVNNYNIHSGMTRMTMLWDYICIDFDFHFAATIEQEKSKYVFLCTAFADCS